MNVRTESLLWWDERLHVWRMSTPTGEVQARFLVGGTGPLHEPSIPDLPGISGFSGTIFHSARWDHGHDLGGRKVAVIGTGSSAIQFVPHIQPQVGQLTVFQRTAPWVLPKPDHAIPPIEKRAFRHVPGLQKAWRGTLYGLLELLQLSQRRPEVMKRLQRLAAWQLKRQVKDKTLRAALTPAFVLGCKRLLLSNSWYPAIQQPNVAVVPRGVRSVTATGVVDTAGVEHACDTIIFATGFRVMDPPIAELVTGLGGQTLAQRWQGSPEAYLGTTVSGFPNLFLTIGPNLGNGHTSALILIEAQAGYIADAVKTMKARRLTSVNVKADVQRRYNEKVQGALGGTVWNSGGCASWYLDHEGNNRSIYPWTTVELRLRLRRFDIAAYQAERRLVVAVTGGAVCRRRCAMSCRGPGSR